MDAKIAHCLSQGQKDKASAFTSLLSEVLSSPDHDTISPNLKALVDAVVNQESVGLVVGRQVLSELVKLLGEKIVQDHDRHKSLVEETLEVVQPRIVSYDEQVCLLSSPLWVYAWPM